MHILYSAYVVYHIIHMQSAISALIALYKRYLAACHGKVCSLTLTIWLSPCLIQAQPREAHPDLRQCLTILCGQVRESEEGMECEGEEEDPGDTAEWHADPQGGPHHDEERLSDTLPVYDSSRCVV